MSGKTTRKNRQMLKRWFLALTVLVLVGVGIWLSTDHILNGQPKNLYTPDDFEMKDGYLTCKTPGSRLGIDVSRYQGEIDWEAVRNAGVEFVFVRVGLRSAHDGLLYEDPRARENLTGARAAGLQVGAYFFSQAFTNEEARAEADFAIDILKDYPLDLPVAFNWETVDGKNYEITTDSLTAITKTFCTAIEEAGYQSMVYFNKDHARRFFDVDALSDYKIWYAQYVDCPEITCKPEYWQYTDQGEIPGIAEKVDINLYLP